MARFLTRRYVAVTWTEAIRLAELDGTPWSEIRRADDVQLLHREEWWAWWADERLTTAIGLPESLCPKGLSPDAVALISEVWESDSPAPQCGWGTLARVQEVLGRERRRALNDRFEALEIVTVRFVDQSQGTLHCWRRRYEEGYELFLEWA